LKLMCSDEAMCQDMLNRIWMAVETTIDLMHEPGAATRQG
jgi:hypothetical protein